MVEGAEVVVQRALAGAERAGEEDEQERANWTQYEILWERIRLGSYCRESRKFEGSLVSCVLKKATSCVT